MVRVMTVNLLNGCADPASLGRVLDAVSPDLVAAQELGPNAAEVLAARFPHGRLEPAVLAIDHVLASGFRAVSVAVHRVRGTDHRALVVDLVPDPPTGRGSPR